MATQPKRALQNTVLIVGAGAVGGFYGFQLARAGVDVSVVCRSEFEEVSRDGFTILSGGETSVFRPSAVFRSVDEAQVKRYDLVIVTTKVLPDLDVGALIAPVVSVDTVIMLLQNGIHIEQAVVDYFPTHVVLSALAFVCLTRTAPGRIVHQGYGRLVLGVYPHGISEWASRVCEWFVSAGLNCKVTDKVQCARWRKLIWNAPFNPLSVIYQKNTQQLLADASIRSEIEAIMQEVLTLAKLDGCDLPAEVIAQNINDTEKMAPYKPSMLIDFEEGRPMEIDAILGNAIAFADAVGEDISMIRAVETRLIASVHHPINRVCTPSN